MEISDIKQSQKQLCAERALLQTVIDSVPAMISIYDPQINEVKLNRAFHETTGWTENDLLHAHVMELVYPDPEYRQIVSAFMQSLAPGFKDLRMTTRSGDIIQASWANKPISDGRQVGIGIDVTERKRVEERLREAEERLRLALAAARAGTFDFRPLHREVIWDEQLKKIWGFPASYNPALAEVVNRVHADDRMRVKENFTKALDPTSSGYYEDQYRIVWPDGSVHWTHSRGRVLFRDEEGQRLAVRVIGVEQEVTEAKQMEERINRHAQELDAANRDLESFAYSVAHDLRNPLRAIGGFTQILMEEYSPLVDENGREYLRRVEEGVRKMQKLIDGMLTLSRIGRQEFERVDVDLSSLVRSNLQELQNGEPQRKVQLSIQENVHAKADPHLIHMALDNLLRNAWKFTCRNELTSIEFSTVDHNGKTAYMLRDNGVGFDMRYAGRLFEPFKRLHGEKEFGGSGVGLSIVQRVISRHEGEIWAEGVPEEGAAFYFTLA